MAQRRVSKSQPCPTLAGDEAGDGEAERHREADQAEVQKRRVERHQDPVLQQRVGPGPWVGTAPWTRANGLDTVSINPKKNAAIT